MVLSLCSRCSDLVQRVPLAEVLRLPRQHHKVPQEASALFPYFTLSAPFKKKHRRRFRQFGSSIRIYLLLALTSTLVQSQPSAYTKRFTTASAVVDKTLYIISGSDSTIGNQTIAEVLALPLHKAFKVDDIPWSRRSNPGVAAEVPQVVTTKRGKYLILVGMGSRESSLVKVYDILNDKWHDLPLSSKREFIDEPRASPAIALDARSGSVIVHGGYSSKTQTISEQLNLLRISSETDFSNWNWNNPSSEKLPRLYQPIMLYVPEVNATLVLGGCTPNDNVSIITSCSSWGEGYLLTTTATESGATINEPRKVTFTGADKTINSVPEARRLPCYVLLENGSVFIYGGLASNGDALKDAWILNVAAGTWLKAPLVSPGRAGGSCEKIGPSQVMVVGGYDANQGSKSFTEPQVAIIDVDKWKYTSKYTPASNLEGGGITEINVWGIVGIVFGICLFFMAIGFLAGRFIWRRRALKLQEAQNKRADSSNPLRPPPRKDHNRNGSSNSSTNNLIPNRTRMMSGNQGSSSATNTGIEDQRKLPLIIVPFPVDTASTVSRSTAPVDVVTPTDVVAPTDMPTTYALLEGDRLPKTMADIQYGHYVRTLQHGKHYDRQRDFEQRTRRVQSGISQHVDLDGDDDYLNDPMVTALANLKEIEVGEESQMIPMQSLETDEMIVSDYTSANKVFDTPQTADLALSYKKDEPYPLNYNTQVKTGMRDQVGNDGRGVMDKYNSIPGGGLFAANTGLGVAVALMGKANPMTVPVQEGVVGKSELISTETGECSEGKAELISAETGETGERSFGKAELTSEETIESEALIDNRRFRNVAHERTWPSN
ncbi:MAG: hypothetical protein J3Q66DRAFT_195995 [Benniella sp.]|nr:MAG: hypothetical protein J3Q66DRAFT_195995 [Benniella sp.]